MKNFSIIISQDKDNGFGFYDKELQVFKMAWYISEELKYFKNITSYVENPIKMNAIIMGYNTWISLPNKLPNRLNVVVSSKLNLECDFTFNCFDTALEYISNLSNIESIFVIGGLKLINSCLNHNKLEHIYITTIINKSFDCNMFIDKNILTNSLGELCWSSEMLINNDTNKLKLKFEKYKNKYKDHPEYNYLNLLQKIHKFGHYSKTRNANTWSIFGETLEYDIEKYGFAILTTKKIAMITMYF